MSKWFVVICSMYGTKSAEWLTIEDRINFYTTVFLYDLNIVVVGE